MGREDSPAELPKRQGYPRMKMRSFPAGAAAAVCTAVTFLAPNYRVSGGDFRTAWDDTRDFAATHDIQARCTGNSHFLTRVTRFGALIHMLNGDCMFFIGHDSSRLVVITTPQGEIRDIGTTLNLTATLAKTVVTTLHGKVQLDSRGRRPVDLGTVSDGEQATIVDQDGVLHSEIHRTPADEKLRLNLFSLNMMKFGPTIKAAVEMFNRNNHDQKICLTNIQVGPELITAIDPIHAADRLIGQINDRLPGSAILISGGRANDVLQMAGCR